MSKIDLSSKLERLEAFEEKYAVRIDNVSAWFDDDYDRISILFELHPATGTTISDDMKVLIVAYNTKGQIMVSEECLFLAQKFWGFAMGSAELDEVLPTEISKIRIYPAAW